MKTLVELVTEAQGPHQPEYLKHTLFGRDEIVRFAAALRDQVLDEAADLCDRAGSYEDPLAPSECAAAIRALKGAK